MNVVIQNKNQITRNQVVSKLLKPGYFSDQAGLLKVSKIKKEQSPYKSNVQAQQQPIMGQRDREETEQKLLISRSQPKVGRTTPNHLSKKIQSSCKSIKDNPEFFKVKVQATTPQAQKKSVRTKDLTQSQPLPNLANAEQLQSDNEILVHLGKLSVKLLKELESFDEFVAGNGIGYYQLESWAGEIKEKLNNVQAQIIQIQQGILSNILILLCKAIESKSSKESTASKDKSLEKEIVINEYQIEDYLDQITSARQAGGSTEIIKALQNGILLKLQQELQSEKNERFRIEQEASNLITIQEQEISQLEQKIRNLEQGIAN